MGGQLKDQSFIKQLVSNDRQVRDRASKTFLNWLHHHRDEDHITFRKLWKALFYCVWMTDKRPIQEQLADRLAQPITKILSAPTTGEESIYFVSIERYLSGFWHAMIVEWGSIDRHRLDKYYFLMRRMIFYTVQYLESISWDQSATISLCAIISEKVLDPSDKTVPDSLRLFLCQAWIEESHSACKKRIPKRILPYFIQPFLVFISRYDNKAISLKAEQEFYNALTKSTEKFSIKTISELYFEYGSNPDTTSTIRKVLYKRHSSGLNQVPTE
jgi:hypothetical protein